MNTAPPNNGPRSNGPGSNGPGDGAGSGSGDSANQDPRWDAFKDGSPEGDRPFNANNPYAQHGTGQQQGQPDQPGQPQQPGHQPSDQGMNAQPGTPNVLGGPAGPNGPGGVEQKGKKGNTGALIAAAIGVVLILGIGTFVACQPGDDEEDTAAETSQTQAADTFSEEATESAETSEDTATEETSESEEAEGTEERDPSKGRPAGTVPFDELEDGDEITLGEGLGPYQEWGTYDGKIVAVPESVDNPGGPSDDLELAKQHAVYYAYQDLKSRAVVTH